MKLLTEGTWWLKSKIDPRWNCRGRAFVGGYMMPFECKKIIEKLEQLYGEQPPDLKWDYEKD